MARYSNYYIRPLMHAKQAPVIIPFAFYTLIATWFFIGRLRIAPGTLGSIAAYPVYYIMAEGSTTLRELELSLAITTAVLCLMGIWAISRFQRTTKTFDHSCVVIDEVVGTLLTVTISYTWLADLARWLQSNYFVSMRVRDLIFIIGLVVFRYFDIRKPLLIGLVDRNVKNAFGVMLDDLLAALFASGTIYIAYLLLQKFG